MNNVVAATRTVLAKYRTFTGRASRAEYWWWFLAVIILMVVLGLVDGAVIAPLLGFDVFAENAGRPLSLLASLVLLLPAIAVSIRRLHDIDRTGWWLLLGLVPVIGFLVLLYFYVQKGDAGPNRFGEPDRFTTE